MNRKPLPTTAIRPLEQAPFTAGKTGQNIRWVLPRASPWGYVRSAL